jgi:hypothetical protein
MRQMVLARWNERQHGRSAIGDHAWGGWAILPGIRDAVAAALSPLRRAGR